MGWEAGQLLSASLISFPLARNCSERRGIIKASSTGDSPSSWLPKSDATLIVEVCTHTRNDLFFIQVFKTSMLFHFS